MRRAFVDALDRRIASSPLRNPRLKQPLINAFASGEVGRIVAWCTQAIAADRKFWIECKRRPCDQSCLIRSADQSQSSRQMEMRDHMISIGFNAAPEPGHGIFVGAEHQPGNTR